MTRKLLLGIFLFSAYFATAQSDYRVVFDMTSKDTVDQQAVIRWLNGITKGDSNAKLEVVMYGKGLNLAVKGRSAVSEDVIKLAQNKNVSFRVCEVALKHAGLEKSQLLPGVETVPDGIYEVITKQREGWGYIKVKN